MNLENGFMFFANSLLLGVGLAMDAFSVSLANGLREPDMRRGRASLIAGVFAVFQALMPLIGWLCVHTVLQYFQAFERFIPWIALALLAWIGGKMIRDSLCEGEDCALAGKLGMAQLLVQGVATSIDALSVGFTIASYELGAALLAAFIIALVTFALCLGGVYIGRKAGTKLAGKAGIFGGVILILIGLEIFITSFI